MADRILSVDSESLLPPAPVRAALAGDLQGTFVVFRNADGSPVQAPKVVAITLTADGNDIDDIRVYNDITEVGE